MEQRDLNDEMVRDALRREAYDLKVSLHELSDRLQPIDKDASWAARQARLQAFEVWSILATPLEDEDDH